MLAAYPGITDGSPGFEVVDDHLRARDVFERASYSESGLQDVLGKSDLLAHRPLDDADGLRRTRGQTSRETLIRLFYLGVAVDVAAAGRALHPMTVDTWVTARLLEVRGHEAQARVKVTPYRDLLLASDRPAGIRTGASPDFVMGVGRSSALLGHTIISRQSRRTLDLGTGSGVLALLVSRHSDHVLATDKNARAIAMARFNARLNGIANVECAGGDLFEPAAGHRFDLVISNPPYVIGPTARYLFTDSGMRGDEFCRGLVRRVPAFLEPGGYCQLMSNWAHGTGQSWQDPLAEWFEGTGCDVLVWVGDTQAAAEYAKTWIQQTEPDDGSRRPETYDAWMNYYEAQGIEAITYGLITLRRSSRASTWVRYMKPPNGSTAPAGTEILRRFQVADFLESIGDDRQLLEQRFQWAPDVRLEQRYARTADGLAAVATRLHLGLEPAVHMMDLDKHVAAFVVRYDGQRTVGDVFTEMATALGVDRDRLVPGGIAVVRQLVQHGYLLPISVSDG